MDNPNRAEIRSIFNKKFLFQVFSIGAIFLFLLSNIFQPNFWSIKTVGAVSDGLGISLDDNPSYSTSLSANIINSGNTSAGSQTLQRGVYHCNTAGTSDCAPDLSSGDIASDSQGITSVMIDIPAPGSTIIRSFAVPSFTCGRVQVDFGWPGHSENGGIVGGRVFNLGSNCVTTPVAPPPAVSCPDDLRYCDTNINKIIHKHGGVPDASQPGGCRYAFDQEGVCNVSAPVTPPAPATPVNITLCDGRVRNWDQIDAELRGANYPGPFDHSQSEIDAYNRAACPPIQPAPIQPAPLAPLTAPTITGVCPAGSTTPTLSWNSVAGAVSFDVRVDNHQGTASFPQKDCGPHAVCVNNWPNTSLTFQGSSDGLYNAWVDAVDASGQRSATSNVTVFSCAAAQPVCTPNGSCSASTPACGTTTTGVDNCGNACTKQGPACPINQLLCQPASQTVQVNQSANFVVNDIGKTVTWSAPNGSPSSGSGLSFATKFAQVGVFNVVVSANGMSSTCQVTTQQAPVVTPAPTPAPVVTPPPAGGPNLTCPAGFQLEMRDNVVVCVQTIVTNNITNNNTNTSSSLSLSSSTSTASNTNNISFGNIGVGAPQPVAVVQPVVIQPQVVQPQVAGVTVTQLPKTGLPLLAWSVLAFIPTGFGMRKFSRIKKDGEDNPTYIWEDRKFKSGV